MNKEITTTKIAIFRKREIRKTIHNNEWWFAVNDVVSALTDSPNVQDYIKKMRKRDDELSKGWGQFVTPLSVRTSGGDQKLNCAKTFQYLSTFFVTVTFFLNISIVIALRSA
jgi:prophage antirepressor-like protein